MPKRVIMFDVPESAWISLLCAAHDQMQSVADFCRDAALEKMRYLDAEREKVSV